MKSSTSLNSRYYKLCIYQLLTKCSPSSFIHLFPHSSPPSPKIHGYSAVPNEISPIRHVSRSPYLGLFCTPAVPRSKAVPPQSARVGNGDGPSFRPRLPSRLHLTTIHPAAPSGSRSTFDPCLLLHSPPSSDLLQWVSSPWVTPILHYKRV